ncbi:MAG: cell division protein FtsQ [Candidatus Cloacimonetes bacterium HGW-Cloacimonetes-3]|jgi:cell division septal protein FtsQ|nr:MAG: cell division protein FtsQ [Candidatus Cloacimonetes bacterium HGW-Cloacimonetes-3]
MENSNSTRKRRGNSRYYLFFFVSLLIVTILGIGTWLALTNLNLFQLKKITISGNTAIPDSLILKATSRYIGMNLLSIPSSDVKNDLKRFSRVKEIKLRKKLLHTLDITVKERKGIIYIKSFEGDLFPIDAEGVVLAKYSTVYTEDIPIFSTYYTGKQLKAGTRLKKPGLNRILNLHQRIAKEAPDFLPLISEYYLIDNTVNIIDAKHGTRIIPSDEDLASQLKRYVFVQDNGNIDRRSVVDLRFKNQVVVKAGNK